jgi:hypothetical protein
MYLMQDILDFQIEAGKVHVQMSSIDLTTW